MDQQPSGKPRKGKSLWQRRLEALQSLCLESIAAEVNRRRLNEVNRQLFAGEPVPKRLQELAGDDGFLRELPSDMRPSAVRMRQLLLGLHRILGSRREWATDMAALAREIGISLRSARRGIADLEAASLIGVTRRKRARWKGGQGPSAYLIVWPTIADLAADQGRQRVLELGAEWVEGATEPVAGGVAGRPDESSGQARPPASIAPASGLAPGHSGLAPGHSGLAPGHSGLAPGHSGTLCHYIPRACAPPHSSKYLLTPPSSSPMEDPGLIPDPSAGGSDGEGGGEIFSSDWEEIAARLVAYGVGDARGTAIAARSNGWAVIQVLMLLDLAERQCVGKVRAWGPGVIWWQLHNALPGSPITIGQCDAYTRAVRERERALERERDQRRQIEARDRGVAQSDLQAVYGARLKRMSRGERRALCRRHSLKFPATWPELLNALHRESTETAESVSSPIADGEQEGSPAVEDE